MPRNGRMTASDSFFRIVARRLRQSESGATVIEYGLIAGIIAIGIIGALTLTRQSLRTQYDCVAMRLDSSGAPVCATGASPGSPNLTGEAGRAQSLLPAGAQILANGLFYDSNAGTGYAASLSPAASPPGAQTVTVQNTETGDSVSLTVLPVAPGVYELPLALLGQIGPGSAEPGTPPGMAAVLYVVPDATGIPRLYYGARPS